MDKIETKAKILTKIFFYSFVILIFIPLALAYRIGNLKSQEEATSIRNENPFRVTAPLVEVETDDGINVRGWYVPSGNKQRIFIIVHGFGQSHEEMLFRLDAVYPKLGSAFFLDLRNHGLSDPSRTSFGYFEASDIIAAVQYFRSRYQSVIIWGTSMGAAASLRAKHLGCEIDILILEAIYSDLRKSIYRYTSKFYIPKYPFAVTGLQFYESLYGINLDDMNMIGLLEGMRDTPVLLIYSDADEDVSSDDFNDLKGVLGQKSMAHIFENGSHVSIYENNRNEYNNLIAQFISEN